VSQFPVLSVFVAGLKLIVIVLMKCVIVNHYYNILSCWACTILQPSIEISLLQECCRLADKKRSPAPLKTQTNK